MKITLTEVLEIVANNAQSRELKQWVRELLAERATLKQQILDLLADDAVKQAKVKAAYEKSEVIEARMHGVVGSTPTDGASAK